MGFNPFKSVKKALGGLTTFATGGLIGGLIGGSSGGGGGGEPTNQFMLEADAQIFLERERAKLTEETRIAADERAAIQREEDLGIFNTKLDQGFNSALQTGTDFFSREGLDLDRFLPLLTERLNTTRQGVPELSSNPSSFFDALLTSQNIVGDELTRDRRGFNLDIDAFAGDNFANNLIPGTFDDSVIAQILSEQFGNASSGITRARDRGSLSDFGFQSAFSNLENQNTAAGARLQDLGGGILETNRNALRDIGGQARSRADAFQFGDSFDPASFENRINTTFGEQQGRLEGDIRGALGGESLFNLSDILARAGSAQGTQNNVAQSPALLASIAQRDEERRASRGIGTQGAF